MTLATMTSKGQVTIPKEVREKLRIKPKDKITFSVEGDHAILRALHGDIRDLKGLFKGAVKGPMDFKTLRRKFEAAMAKRQLEILERSRSR
jgi:antitoxin PrlF